MGTQSVGWNYVDRNRHHMLMSDCLHQPFIFCKLSRSVPDDPSRATRFRIIVTITWSDFYTGKLPFELHAC